MRGLGAWSGRRRPLVGAFFAYAVGTWCGLCLPPAYGLLLAVFCAIGTVAAFRLCRRALWLFPLAVVAWSLALHRGATAEGTSWLPPAGSGQRVLGIIASDPEKTYGGNGGGSSWSMQLRDARWHSDGGRWIPFSQDLVIRWRGPAHAIPATYGDLVEFSGRYAPSRPERQQSSSGILYTGYDNTHVIASGHGAALRRWCFSQRHAARLYLHAGLDESGKTATVLDALLLGYRRQMGYHMTDQFARTGTIHIFAISGLHVGIIALLMASVLKLLRVSRTHWGLVMTPVLVFYVMATGAKPSAVRACLMASIYVMAPLLKREADALSALAAAALVIVAVDPTDLLNVGFILSFSVVAGLILLFPIVWRVCAKGIKMLCNRAEEEELAKDAMFMPAAKDLSGSKGTRSGPLRYLASVSVLTICAWLVSTPLTAYYFERFTPVSLVTNMFAIPLTFVIVLLGCLSILLGAVWFPLAVLINKVNALSVWMLLTVTGLADSIPGSCIAVPSFPAWAVWLWFAVLAAVAFLVRAHLPMSNISRERLGSEESE